VASTTSQRALSFSDSHGRRDRFDRSGTITAAEAPIAIPNQEATCFTENRTLLQGQPRRGFAARKDPRRRQTAEAREAVKQPVIGSSNQCFTCFMGSCAVSRQAWERSLAEEAGRATVFLTEQ